MDLAVWLVILLIFSPFIVVVVAFTGATIVAAYMGAWIALARALQLNKWSRPDKDSS